MMKRGIFIMQENVLENNAEREKQAFVKMLQLEDLAEKKAKIYSRLLMDVEKAQEMEGLAARHAARKIEIEKMLFGDEKKAK